MHRKLITFAVPCYNSADYMETCIRSLLTAGEEAEIILVDDGSGDETPAICDRYAAEYPSMIRVIHQENGGHGEGVNQGLRHAEGLYYKVVDSDDWLDEGALRKVMDKLRVFGETPRPVDLVIANYVYEHVEDGTRRPVRYLNVFPRDRVFTWDEIGRFRTAQFLLMHSAIYRTELLRECGLTLPRHTFYVDNLFVYQPLPYVETLYYLNEDLYRYFIGRSDQSVNEKVMLSRIDQQVRVTRLMIDSHDLRRVKADHPRLGRYMTGYLNAMLVICSAFLTMEGTPGRLAEKREIWRYMREKNRSAYHKMKYRTPAFFCCIPGKVGSGITMLGYRIARKVNKFN